jgi:threonine/homoserine/homoserine lactone efflux protein
MEGEKSMDISLLLSGAVLGLTAGLSPGPTQMFLISQTVQHGIKEGFLWPLSRL